MNKNDLVVLLSGLGLHNGDHVMVHSSLKSLGYVEGGADAVIDAILEVVGQAGTLFVPTNTFQGYVTSFLRSVHEVDLRVAPSATGLISETVRLRTGSARSIHPSHPVCAIGGKARELLGEHHLGNSPMGERSPYGRLARLGNGKVLLIGVTNSNNTMIHTAEEYYAPYIFNGETFHTKVISADGQAYIVETKGYCMGLKRNFTALDTYLEKQNFLSRAAVAKGVVSLIDASGLMETAKAQIQKNPHFLVDKA
jgi:aminoglycoside 3-N-acetyltransferase